MVFRKLLTIIVYTGAMLIIGRNLMFLPKITSIYTPATSYALASEKKQLDSYLTSQTGDFSYYISDFSSPLTIKHQEETVFTGASVNKVPIVAVLYYLASKGKIDLEKRIVLQKADIQDYGTGSLRYQKPGGVYSLKTLAKLTLQQSDNTATYILANHIGRDTVQEIITQWGLSQTDMVHNKTSLADMELLYRKLYTGKVTSKALTKELLGFMQDTENETRLPAQLPSNTTTYHKTGDGVGFVHDVGIVTMPGHVYFIGVMTRDVSGKEKQTDTAISTVSKMVYDFMKQQG